MTFFAFFRSNGAVELTTLQALHDLKKTQRHFRYLKKKTQNHFLLRLRMARMYYHCKVLQHRRLQNAYPTPYLSRSLPVRELQLS